MGRVQDPPQWTDHQSGLERHLHPERREGEGDQRRAQRRGFQGEVTVVDNGSATLNGWTVRLTLAGGQSLANVWNGINTGTGGMVSVRNADYNGSLGANASTTFGFLVNGSTDTAPGTISCTSP